MQLRAGGDSESCVTPQHGQKHLNGIKFAGISAEGTVAGGRWRSVAVTVLVVT